MIAWWWLPIAVVLAGMVGATVAVLVVAWSMAAADSEHMDRWTL